MTNEFLNSNTLKVSYRSGNGEAFLSTIKVWDGQKWIEPSINEEDSTFIENYFNHIIRRNEHDNQVGYGYFVSEKGKITETEYNFE